MPTLESALAWLASLPQGALLAAMALLAGIENIFPPIPADVMVAFGSFVAARSGNPAWPVFLAVWGGNMLGVAVMFFLGRRLGKAWIARRYHLEGRGRADARILRLHEKYGTFAFFISRFVPGVRAVVPPVAGALHIPFTGAMLAMSAASALWYGAITVLAFRAGNNWERLRDMVARLGWWTAGVALALGLAIAFAIWWRRRSRAGANTA
ncbi:MAG: DedA family protein [Gemmatimonadaceae bacterium]